MRDVLVAIEPFRLCLALGPLAIYLLLLGLINLSRRPFLVTGPRDAAALGLAVAGLLVVGPIELVLPYEAVLAYGWLVWLLLAVMYGLCLSLLVLLGRPRITIYNISPEVLRPVLSEVISGLDPHARWAGSSVVLPGLMIDLHVERYPLARNVTLVANSDQQSLAGWRTLAAALRRRLKMAESARGAWGAGLALVGLLLLALLFWTIASNPQAVTQGFQEMIRL
ncbi:MAG: hypothetical protein K6T86_15375 [Pirellulales bacterium]|nr:hypothetical protein [Pirellulales bacterium]